MSGAFLFLIQHRGWSLVDDSDNWGAGGYIGQVLLGGGELVGQIVVLLFEAAYAELIAHKAWQEYEDSDEHAGQEREQEDNRERAREVVGKEGDRDRRDVL